MGWHLSGESPPGAGAGCGWAAVLWPRVRAPPTPPRMHMSGVHVTCTSRCDPHTVAPMIGALTAIALARPYRLRNTGVRGHLVG